MNERTIKFRNGDEILTLWVEKYVDDHAVGWCPELKNSMVVDPHNIVREDVEVDE